MEHLVNQRKTFMLVCVLAHHYYLKIFMFISINFISKITASKNLCVALFRSYSISVFVFFGEVSFGIQTYSFVFTILLAFKVPTITNNAIAKNK